MISRLLAWTADRVSDLADGIRNAAIGRENVIQYRKALKGKLNAFEEHHLVTRLKKKILDLPMDSTARYLAERMAGQVYLRRTDKTD